MLVNDAARIAIVVRLVCDEKSWTLAQGMVRTRMRHALLSLRLP
jgi:hypothetical protein